MFYEEMVIWGATTEQLLEEAGVSEEELREEN